MSPTLKLPVGAIHCVCPSMYYQIRNQGAVCNFLMTPAVDGKLKTCDFIRTSCSHCSCYCIVSCLHETRWTSNLRGAVFLHLCIFIEGRWTCHLQLTSKKRCSRWTHFENNARTDHGAPAFFRIRRLQRRGTMMKRVQSINGAQFFPQNDDKIWKQQGIRNNLTKK